RATGVDGDGQVARKRRERRGARRAVERIVQDRAAEGRAVNADLMGTSGVRAQLEPGKTAAAAEQPIVGIGGLAGRIGDHAPSGLAGDLAERQLDPALRGGGRADDDGPIDLLDAAGGEQAAELAAVAAGSREKHTAAPMPRATNTPGHPPPDA